MDPIRKQISEVASKPGTEDALRGRLKQLAGRQGQSLSEDHFALLIRHLHEYVESAPDLLQACLDAASRAGFAAALKPIIERAAQYFLEPEDYIPDDWGLLGLLDDAYLVHSLMSRVSSHHEHHAGVPLLPVDLEGATQVTRWIIGEPIISQLDESVEKALRSNLILQQLGQLARHDKTLSFTGAPSATWTDAWEDEMVEIAADCGISVDL